MISHFKRTCFYEDLLVVERIAAGTGPAAGASEDDGAV